MAWTLIVCSVLMLAMCIVHGNSKRNKDGCLTMTEEMRKAKLKCKRSVIYDIEVNSFVSPDNKCEDVGQCSGLQDNVLAESNGCYWKSRCYIKYSSLKPIILTSNVSCIGEHPTALQYRQSCIKENALHFFHNGSVVKRDSQNMASDMGMLVSHRDYPWHYPSDLDLSLTLLPANSRYDHLYLWVHKLEIDPQRDKAQVGSGGHTSNLTKGRMILSGPEARFTFQTDTGTIGAQGFVVCYRWGNIGEGETFNKEKICDAKRKKKSKNQKTKKPKKTKKSKKSKKSKRGRRRKPKKKNDKKSQ